MVDEQPLVKKAGPVSSGASGVAIRALQKELRDLHKEPLEGFTVDPNPKDIFKWRVGIYGPPDTLYQGGYFKAQLNFPSEYPFAPPSLHFTTPMWHPNIYKNGDVCISILHAPGEDELSGEQASERWLPTQGVYTVPGVGTGPNFPARPVQQFKKPEARPDAALGSSARPGPTLPKIFGPWPGPIFS